MSLRERVPDVDAGETVTAAAYGAVAYLAGYAVTYGLTADDVRRAMRGPLGLGQSAALPDTWTMVGWLFYATHRVRVEATLRSPQLDASRTSVVDVTASGAWDQTLLLVPPVVLAVAGYLLARRLGREGGEAGLRHGLLLVAGYAPLAVLGVFVFRWRYTASAFGVEATATVAPALVEAFLFAGVVYPVVFGGVGGYLAALTGSSGRPRP